MNPTATSPHDCQHGRHARACETCAAAAEIADLRAEVERERAARQQAQTQLEQTKAERNRSGIKARREAAERMRTLEAERNELRANHAAALDLVSRVRMALGDNGARMQDELVEWCKTLRANDERYRWLRDTPGSFTVFAEACSESMDEDVDAARKDAP